MRVFLAGATGIIGRRLVPAMLEAGHDVVGMTRSDSGVERLRDLGATPVVCDVFDVASLRRAVVEHLPQVVMHQLTDLPDDVAKMAEFAPRNARIRREGTRNLLDAAAAAGAARFFAQSVAFELPGDSGRAVRDLEQMVLDASGVVLRYGQFHGPGTYHESGVPDGPAVEVGLAAARTVDALDAPTGIVTILDD